MKSTEALDGYERVKERKKRFYSQYADGRIVVEMIAGDAEWAQFKAIVFKTAEDQKNNLPLATGYAQEFRGEGGFANNDAWLENCEESAIGRALDNAGFSGNDKCSREEMEKALKGKQNSGPRLSPMRQREAQMHCGQPMRKSQFKVDGQAMVYCPVCRHKEPAVTA